MSSLTNGYFQGSRPGNPGRSVSTASGMRSPSIAYANRSAPTPWAAPTLPEMVFPQPSAWLSPVTKQLDLTTILLPSPGVAAYQPPKKRPIFKPQTEGC